MKFFFSEAQPEHAKNTTRDIANTYFNIRIGFDIIISAFKIIPQITIYFNNMKRIVQMTTTFFTNEILYLYLFNSSDALILKKYY
jgi:hypothetical protein